MPHAYAVSGFLIVERESVKPLNMNPGDAMKMAVSGGMAGYDDEEEPETKKAEEITQP